MNKYHFSVFKRTRRLSQQSAVELSNVDANTGVKHRKRFGPRRFKLAIRFVDTGQSPRSGGTPFADRYRTLVLMLRDPRTLTRCTPTGYSPVRPIFRRRHAPNKDFGPDWRTLFFLVLLFSLSLSLSFRPRICIFATPIESHRGP